MGTISYFAALEKREIMKNLKSILRLALIAIIITSCVDDDDNGNRLNGPTALDFLIASPDHTAFVEALELTQLDFTLSQDNSLTIFAPTDPAFNRFLAANNFSSVGAIPIDQLRQLLQYHMQAGLRTVDQINSQYYKTQAQTNSFQMDAFVLNNNDAITINKVATVTNGDNRLSNAVVHVVDEVLPLPSINDLVEANPSFDNLSAALGQEGLDLILGDTDNSSAPFTVFAPDNNAFDNLIALDPNDNLNNLQDVLNINNLDNLLLYHVLGISRLRQVDFEDATTLNPIGMGTFVINTTSGVSITDGSNTTVRLTSTDVTALNGVIHTVDLVLRNN